MDNKSMHNQSSNEHVIHNTNHQQPLTIYSNLSRSTDIQYCYERPMMLNTWTQTELGISDDSLQNIKQREKALLQEIHNLKTELNKRYDLLAQSSSGRSNSSHFQKTPGAREVIVNQMPVQLHANHPHLMQRQQQQQDSTTQFHVNNTQISPRNIHCQQLSQTLKSPQQRPALHSLHQNSIQTPYMTEDVAIQQQDRHTVTNIIQSGRPRKVNYKIIADGSVNDHDGPIEIEIADEENTLNLNGSANSERLEIFFAEEQPQYATNVNYVKFDNDTEQNMSNEIPEQNMSNEIPEQNMSNEIPEQNMSNEIPEQNSVTPDPSEKRFKMSTGNVSNYPNQNNCESPESPQTVSHYSNTCESPESSQYPDSQNCEINNQHQGRSRERFKNSYTMIGPNNTRVPTETFDSINWGNPSMATRKLMMAIFDRETLATHSMTGKPSPAFKHNKPLKQMLNPSMIQDIIFAVTRRCRVTEKEVRNAITTKCSDENKLLKQALAKAEQNKENFE